MMTKNLIKRHLIKCAFDKKFVTYGELVKELNLPFDLTKAQDRKTLGEQLGSISKEEDGNGLPLLSSLVLHSVKMLPGDGFFDMAAELGKDISSDSSKEHKVLFAQKEQAKCFKFWKR